MTCADQTKDPNPTPPEPRRYDLGILLVHGIGEQKQGETLSAFCQPIIQWINDWLTRDPDLEDRADGSVGLVDTKPVSGTAQFRNAVLRPPQLPAEAPANATVEIQTRLGSCPADQQRWLFVESWWSPQAIAPHVAPFLRWLITRGSWILLLHLHERSGFDYDRWFKNTQAKSSKANFWAMVQLVGQLLTVAVWLGLTFLLLVAWLIASFVALIPIGRLRQRIYALLLQVTGVIGDSYVLIAEPIQRAAFEATTQQALDWLAPQCDRVAIVAHSQGAAVAHRLLVATELPQVDLFVTVGAGIAKLESLRHQERLQDSSAFLWCALAPPLTVASLLVYWILSARGYTGLELWGPTGLLGVLSLTSVMIAWGSVVRTPDEAAWRGRDLWLSATRRKHTRWLDIYSTHDPVPNGPLSRLMPKKESGSAGPFLMAKSPEVGQPLEEHEVAVHASCFLDHTRYWESQGDFLPLMISALDRCTGSRIFGSPELPPAVIEVREAFRRGAKQILARQFPVSLLTFLILLACFISWQGGLPGHDPTIRASADLRDLIETAPFDTISDLPSDADRLVERISDFAKGSPRRNRALVPAEANPTPVVDRRRDGLVTAAFFIGACGLALYLWNIVFGAFWRLYVALLLRKLFLPRSSGLGILSLPLARWAAVFVGITPLLVALYWSLVAPWLGQPRLDQVAVAVGVIALLIIHGLFFVGLSLFAARRLPREFVELKARSAKCGEQIEKLLGIPIMMILWGAGGWFFLKQATLVRQIGVIYWLIIFGYLAFLALLTAFLQAFATDPTGPTAQPRSRATKIARMVSPLAAGLAALGVAVYAGQTPMTTGSWALAGMYLGGTLMGWWDALRNPGPPSLPDPPGNMSDDHSQMKPAGE